MKHLLLFTLLVACAPTQPEETDGCASLSDCDLGKVCDLEIGECIDEPPDRFIGSFHCTIEDYSAPGLGFDVGEVVGNIGIDRWSFPAVFCDQTSANDQLRIVATTVFSDDVLSVFADPADFSDRRASVGPGTGLKGSTWARVVNDGTATAYGYSKSGRIELSSAPSIGKEVTGYLDIVMYPAIDEEVLFGIPCPRGLVDCGSATGDLGGATSCRDLQSGPSCTRSCTANGDCSRGNGVCVQGHCTTACVDHADCEAPLECFGGNAGESNGCF